MPVVPMSVSEGGSPYHRRICTIHNQYVQALLHGQGGIEVDKSEAKREDIVASADLEEVAY